MLNEESNLIKIHTKGTNYTYHTVAYDRDDSRGNMIHDFVLNLQAGGICRSEFEMTHKIPRQTKIFSGGYFG